MDHMKVAERITSAQQLYAELGKLDPMTNDQALLLTCMTILDKTKIIKQYEVLHILGFNE